VSVSCLPSYQTPTRYTPRRALTHGVGDYVGEIAIGKLADLALWKPENFGSKPEMVLKGGVIVWANVCGPSLLYLSSLTLLI
jgi:urease alpha subunit